MGGGTVQRVFDECQEAIDLAMREKSFGVYYSEKASTGLSMHVHEVCEVNLALSDGATFVIDNKIYAVKRGDLFIINPFESHKLSVQWAEKFVRFAVSVHPTFLYENSGADVDLSDCFYASKESHRITLSEEEIAKLIDLLHKISGNYDYGEEILQKSYALQFFLEVNRLFHLRSEKKEKVFEHGAVQLAVDYINKNYAQELDLETIAKASYVSVSQLCRLFRRYCSTTVTRFIVSKRITMAKKLLTEGKSVMEVAFLSGFNDYAHFIRTFKKIVGVPPGKYKTPVGKGMYYHANDN